MFNPRFIGILKHPGYNGFDPLSATVASTLAASAAAPAVAGTLASQAVIPSILTGIGGIGAGNIAALTAANAAALPALSGTLASSVTPSILTGIGGIGAADTAALASALGGAAPGTVGSTLASSGLSNIAGNSALSNIAGMGANAGVDAAGMGLIGSPVMGAAGATPEALAAYNASVGAGTGVAGDVASGGLSALAPQAAQNAGISLNNIPVGVDPQTGLPSAQFDFNAANAANTVPGAPGVNVGTGMPGGTPGAPGVNVPSDAIGKSVIDQVPGNPAFDVTSPSFTKFGQGATEAQGILGKMGLGGLEDFYNKNKLLSNAAGSIGMSMLKSNQSGGAPIKKYDGPLNKYRLAADYKAVDPVPNVYKPSYAAEGGIMSFASGGSAKKATSGQVYFDADKGKYYTQSGPQNFGMSPGMGYMYGAVLPERSYLDTFLGGGSRTLGSSVSAPVQAQIYRPEYQNQAPTQPQTNVPVSAAQADPGLWNESMYSPMFAEGGIASYGLGGDVNTNYPQAHQDMTQFANQNQLPTTARNIQYEPKTDSMTGEMIGYADGGVASYAFGDLVQREEKEVRPKLSNPLLEYYSKHTKAKEMMAKPDVGIFHDSDPDTRNLDAQQAAMVRLRKQFSRAQMKQPKTNLKEMPALGTLPGVKQEVQEAADGGIMGYSLGGYAHGGNPRLLRGPGDGMSDNIPATIANRQPARLADGEFVVPADVVSHLGNGSTEAGAKHLHKMMDKVRVARTGKKKQGTQINPSKFVPA
jgi:hypothetical protein